MERKKNQVKESENTSNQKEMHTTLTGGLLIKGGLLIMFHG